MRLRARIYPPRHRWHRVQPPPAGICDCATSCRHAEHVCEAEDTRLAQVRVHRITTGLAHIVDCGGVPIHVSTVFCQWGHGARKRQHSKARCPTYWTAQRMKRLERLVDRLQDDPACDDEVTGADLKRLGRFRCSPSSIARALRTMGWRTVRPGGTACIAAYRSCWTGGCAYMQKQWKNKGNLTCGTDPGRGK